MRKSYAGRTCIGLPRGIVGRVPRLKCREPLPSQFLQSWRVLGWGRRRLRTSEVDPGREERVMTIIGRRMHVDLGGSRVGGSGPGA